MSTNAIERLMPVFDTGFDVPYSRSLVWMVRSYTRDETIGCDQCEIEVFGSDDDEEAIQRLINLLGVRMSVINEVGDKRWWGLVEEVVLGIGGISFGLSLRDMANRIAVAWTDYAGARNTTAWTEDVASVGRWGPKERQISMTDATQASAENRRDRELGILKMPQGTLSFQRSDDARPRATLNCIGFAKALDWVYYANPNGVHEHTMGGGEQNFGEGTDINRVAQVINPPHIAVPFTRVVLPLLKQGAPSDNVNVDLYTGATHGSGTFITNGTIPAASIPSDAMRDIEAVLADEYVADGNPIQIVLRRSGSNDSDNYYKVGVDTNKSYGLGTMKVRVGTTWQNGIPADADMQFRLYGQMLNTDQIKYAVTNFALNKQPAVLLAVDLESWSDALTIPYRRGDQTLLKEIQKLLEGSFYNAQKLLMQSTPDRRLRIYREPQGYQYTMDRNGDLYDLNAMPVAKSACPVGCTIRLRDVFPAIEASVNYQRFLEVPVAQAEYAVQYDQDGRPISDSYRFTPRGAQDIFDEGAKQG